MTTNLRYENIIKKSSDELFSEYSIEELGQIIDKLGGDVNSKKQKLRMLVGNKYRDLLSVADDIMKMDTISTKQNEELTDLIYKKSNYNSKFLINLSRFNNSINDFKLQSLQSENMDKVFYNLVHDLSYLLLCLKNNLNYDDQENETPDESEFDTENPDFEEFVNNYKTVSNHLMNDFVIIAKHIYLIDYFFANLIIANPCSVSVMQLNNSRNEFHHIVEYYVSKLRHESDSDFILNLSLSFIISTKNDADVIDWITSKRLNYFQRLIKSKSTFHDLLNYVYTTIEFINTLKSRLSLLVNRVKSNNASSSWIRQTPFKKWEKWLKTENCDFKIQSSGFIKRNTDEIVNSWKENISNLLVSKFDEELVSSSKNLIHMVTLLKSALISFKNFSSLASLPVGEKNIVNYVIEEWKRMFSTELAVEINEFSVFKNLVIETFNSEEKVLELIDVSEDTFLIDYSRNFSIDYFFEKLHDKKPSNSVFMLLDDFRRDLGSIVTSMESLKALSLLIVKPIISVDDTDDEVFWKNISQTLVRLLETSVEESIFHLSESVNGFFDKLKLEISKGAVSNTRYFYIIRILTELEGKIRLKEFYETLNKFTITNNYPVEMEKSIEELLESCFEFITNSVFESMKPHLNNIFANRLQKEYNEISLWETVDNKHLPTTCSIEINTLLLTFVDSLVKAENSTYADLFTLKAFEKSRIKTISLFVEAIENFVKENRDFDDDKLLITYADYLFLKFMKSDIEEDRDIELLFVERFHMLEDEGYRKKILNMIEENYKKQSL
ncbi:hypothetical protein CANINC_002186, partial [Pichia inconspicua]